MFKYIKWQFSDLVDRIRAHVNDDPYDIFDNYSRNYAPAHSQWCASHYAEYAECDCVLPTAENRRK